LHVAPRSDPDAPVAEDPPPAPLLHAAAQRSRNRKSPQSRAESGGFGKAAAASPAPTAGKVPVTPADPKIATPPPEPPPPDEWSDQEIIAALKDCLRRLAPLGARVTVAEPIRQERCGTPAPVVLIRIGSGADAVEFQPPATLNCAMVVSLHTWVEKTLQPAAQQLLGSPVTRIRNASGYACRNRVGSLTGSDRLSEHASANAIDIAGFVTADGRRVDVLRQWGPTASDLREEEERAEEAAAKADAAAVTAEKQAAEAATAARAERGAKQADANARAARTKQEAERKRQEAWEKQARLQQARMRTAQMQKLGRSSDAGDRPPRVQRRDGRKNAAAKGQPPAAIPVSTDQADDRVPAEAAFLRRLHDGACGTFTTVLGPDANAAHRNHFHFDLAARKRRAALCR
jgi:hypothetical protein